MKTQFRIVGPFFQAGLFAIGLVALTIIFSSRFHTYIAHDPPVHLRHVKTDKVVTMGLHIMSFSTFDVVRNNFVLEAMAWFEYDPTVVTLDEIKNFDIVHGQLLHKSKPVSYQKNNSEVAQFNVRIQFDTFLNYRLFPIDDHNIRLSITNHYLPKEVILVSSDDDITFEDDLYLPGWQIRNVVVDTGLAYMDLVRGHQPIGTEFPQTVISFECERTDPSIVVNILLTLGLILFMSLLTFSSREDSILVVSVIIVALIGYRAVMLSIGPTHISYFMLSDYMYLITLSCCVLTILAGVFAQDEKLKVETKKRIIIGIYALFIGGCSLMSFIL